MTFSRIISVTRTHLLLLLALTASCTGTIGEVAQAESPDEGGLVVAITFDDLPYVDEQSTETKSREKNAFAAHQRIVRALRRGGVPATGFVNETKVQALGETGPRLLADWNMGLLELGNHGHSHLDSNELDLEGIEREIVTGEETIRPMAAAVGRTVPFFRFPYNHVGDTEPKRQAIESLLEKHGYSLAASTIDTSDYLFNSAYERAFAASDGPMIARIEREYLNHTRVQIDYYGELDNQVIGSDIPAIMLLHANRLNAAVIDRLLNLFRSADYRFVSLARAQSDPAYATMPAFATKFGPMWGYRWARERQIKVDGRLEQEPPAWVEAYANGTGE